ncbi:hypothetical protein Ccrd_012295 [Cynara cardunculus var. scolymus]|uniref:Uncharacterized protein n=1 Tax=Cynara cardunculus var. scolymus TaxID=59895 RepID=A0A103YHT8_CYNCS|nr:hypothetical protein Ccrd_012295 [Cynara cardunculus var. scolymus]
MEVAKLLYIVVEDDFGGNDQRRRNEDLTFRYTRHVLQSALQLMGCKARHAFKISQRVFEIMRTECLGDTLAAMGVIKTGKDFLKVHPGKENSCVTDGRSDKEGRSRNNNQGKKGICDGATVRYQWMWQIYIVCFAGKSASRLGITTVISTDSIRHMMRSFVDEKQNPLLWSSTYHAGEHLDPVAVSEAKAKRKAKKQGSVSPQSQFKTSASFDATAVPPAAPKEGSASSATIDLISPKQMAIEGFKAQSEMVIDSLDRLITAWEERKESVVVEGVHLSLNFVGMFQLIQRQGSSRNLMALLNDDGSVAKAWPVHSVDANGKPIVGHPAEDGIGMPMYGPLQIGKAEPVNLQFGNFGISAWQTDLGCTSRASSVDESKGELTDNGSRYHSSCCSSPKVSDGPAKELKEEQSVYGSDEEVDDHLEVDSDEDLSDDAKEHMHEEMEGSVDEESTKSDEEYDDLAMQDIQENGYFTDDEFDPNHNNLLSLGQHDTVANHHGDKYNRNLDRFLRAKSEPGPDSVQPNPGMIKERRLLSSGSFKVKRRSHSISSFGKDGPLSPTLSRVATTLSRDLP